MNMIRAVIMPGPNQPVEIRELPAPQLEPDSGLLAVELSEVCGTDVHLLHGRLGGVPYPIIPGHVSVGRLAQIRGRLIDVVSGKPFSEGDRVTFLDVHRTCNACYHCLVAKAATRCPQRRVYGITYGLADGLTGGWAERLYLKPGTRCLSLDGVDFETFMAGGCALPTALHAVQRGEVSFGETVLVLGSGPVGLAAVILSKIAGAERVLCIGAPDLRLNAAREAGADATLSIETHTPEARGEWVRGHTGSRGADVTLEVSGAPGAVVQAMRYTRDGGRVVIAGQYTDGGDASFNPHHDLNRKHLDVRGCWGSDFSHFHRAVRIMADPARRAPWTRLALQRYSLDQANTALDDVAAGRVIKALIDPTRQ